LELCHVACGHFRHIAAETGKSGEAAAAALPHQKQKKVRVYLCEFFAKFYANRYECRFGRNPMLLLHGGACIFAVCVV
jgi:hypothetical protein